MQPKTIQERIEARAKGILGGVAPKPVELSVVPPPTDERDVVRVAQPESDPAIEAPLAVEPHPVETPLADLVELVPPAVSITEITAHPAWTMDDEDVVERVIKLERELAHALETTVEAQRTMQEAHDQLAAVQADHAQAAAQFQTDRAEIAAQLAGVVLSRNLLDQRLTALDKATIWEVTHNNNGGSGQGRLMVAAATPEEAIAKARAKQPSLEITGVKTSGLVLVI
jgi:hypothetical protein